MGDDENGHPRGKLSFFGPENKASNPIGHLRTDASTLLVSQRELQEDDLITHSPHIARTVADVRKYDDVES